LSGELGMQPRYELLVGGCVARASPSQLDGGSQDLNILGGGRKVRWSSSDDKRIDVLE
jgi:hypothetical protein